MARGFESKSVADQQEEEFRERAPRDDREEPALARQRRGLELARADVLARLKTAQSEAHRRLLSCSLAALDEQLAVLKGRRG